MRETLKFLYHCFITPKDNSRELLERDKSLPCLCSAKADFLDFIGEEISTPEQLKEILESGEHIAAQMKKAGLNEYPLNKDYTIVLNHNTVTIRGNHEKSENEPRRT